MFADVGCDDKTINFAVLKDFSITDNILISIEDNKLIQCPAKELKGPMDAKLNNDSDVCHMEQFIGRKYRETI